MQKSDKPKYRHILIIRTSALGDVAMLPHAVRAFRLANPEVKVTILTREFLAPLFDGLDVEFLFADFKGRHKGIAGLWSLSGEIKRLGVDAIADTHGVLRSRILRHMCFLRAFIPYKTINKGRIAKWFRMGYSRHSAVPLRHSVLRYCDVLRRLGFSVPTPEPAVKPHLKNPMGEKSGIWIGFAPFSAHKGKTYPEDMCEELVEKLSRRYTRVFIHSGGGEEAVFAERMEAKYDNVTALWSRLKMREERDLISHLDCVVTMDSFVMHLASLTATPTVSIWGATHPELGFYGYGVSEAGKLQVEMPCRPCSVYGNKPCKSGDYKCLRAITPQMVIEKIDEMLS
ncbi:MAG: glycosyltransferase family 9 protein [Alistipes sp.]|nr:glycosyltransferase family 9 protein [Alistipes sp.]